MFSKCLKSSNEATVLELLFFRIASKHVTQISLSTKNIYRGMGANGQHVLRQCSLLVLKTANRGGCFIVSNCIGTLA